MTALHRRSAKSGGRQSGRQGNPDVAGKEWNRTDPFTRPEQPRTHRHLNLLATEIEANDRSRRRPAQSHLIAEAQPTAC